MGEQRVEVELNRLNWILEFKVIKHFRMEDSHSANGLSIKDDREAAGWQVSRVVFVLLKLVVLDESSADLGHDQIKETVNNFEV